VVYRVLKEPLTHFIVLGGLIFAAYAWLGSGDAGQDDRKQIVIDQAKLDHLKKLWKLQWRRDPAPTDLAVKLARDLGITLLGFVRGKRISAYTNDWRITHHGKQ